MNWHLDISDLGRGPGPRHLRRARAGGAGRRGHPRRRARDDVVHEGGRTRKAGARFKYDMLTGWNSFQFSK